MKRYGIKEVFGTLQGEGGLAGAPSVFLRFAGCNLGYEVCSWCDTDWVKATYTLEVEPTVDLINKAARAAFGREGHGLWITLTGGEPSLQVDYSLADALRNAGYRLAMESNGSRLIEPGLADWLTISPKQREFVQRTGNDLKIVFTGRSAEGIAASTEAVLEIAKGTDFDNYFLQPVDVPALGGPNYRETVEAVMRLGSPWRLSLQMHKVVGIQ